MSGMVPLTGRTPRPSDETNSWSALAIIQKGLVVGLGVIEAAMFKIDCMPEGIDVGTSDVLTAFMASSKFSSVSLFSLILIPR